MTTPTPLEYPRVIIEHEPMGVRLVQTAPPNSYLRVESLADGSEVVSMPCVDTEPKDQIVRLIFLAWLQSQAELLALRARVQRVAQTERENAERPICAAVQFADGRIALGHRHSDCYHCADGWAPKPEYTSVQGFMTSRKRFVDRAEALRLERAADPRCCVVGDILFSEDLY